ncbi:DapH/DapD/GlmU-related protein [Lewinella sp. LCG006]|uniref:acyltransferase n=1 Tax=Lewinella sp. LCG006 TaxID=3231911 RepID=UPI00345F47FD
MRKFSLFLYYLILNKLPHSSVPLIGLPCERLKEFFAKRMFSYCGTNVNIGKGARFGNGKYIRIGNNSGIGMNAKVPNNIQIGEDVMMGPNVTIFGANHEFSRTDIPMRKQGMKTYPPVEIEDDVWIGSNVIIMPGLVIKKGTIIGAGAVVTKSFPAYSIIGGNPAKFIRSRKM